MPNQSLSVRKQAGKIWSHIRQTWLVETPDERVRQKYVCTLVNHFGHSLDQMDEEVCTQHGRDSGRADGVIWRTVQHKADRTTLRLGCRYGDDC